MITSLSMHRFSGKLDRNVGLGHGAPITLSGPQEQVETLLRTGKKAWEPFESVPNMTASVELRPHWLPVNRPPTFLLPDGGEIPAGQVQSFSLDVQVTDTQAQTVTPRVPAWCSSVQLDDHKQHRSTARLGLGDYQGQLYLLGDESEVKNTATRAGSLDHPPRFRLITPLKAIHIRNALDLLVGRLRTMIHFERVASVRSDFRVDAYPAPSA